MPPKYINHRMAGDIHILEQIRKGETRTYRTLYTQYFGMVKYLVVKNRGTEEDASDVFQDTMVVLYEKLSDPGFELTCTLKTYIYSVARNIWYSRVRKNKENFSITDFEEMIETDNGLEEKEKTERQLTIMEQCMEALGDPCTTLLKQFYYFKKSMAEIADLLDYSNADHAKSQKYKCIKRLKKLTAEAMSS